MSPKLKHALDEWRDPHSFNRKLDVTPIGRIRAAFAVALSPDMELAVEAYQNARALVAENLPQDRTIEDLSKDPKYRKIVEAVSLCMSARRRAAMLLRKAVAE